MTLVSFGVVFPFSKMAKDLKREIYYTERNKANELLYIPLIYNMIQNQVIKTMK